MENKRNSIFGKNAPKFLAANNAANKFLDTLTEIVMRDISVKVTSERLEGVYNRVTKNINDYSIEELFQVIRERIKSENFNNSANVSVLTQCTRKG